MVEPIVYTTRTKPASFKADPELWSKFKETCGIRPQGDAMYGDVHGGWSPGLFSLMHRPGPRALSTSPMDRLKRGVSICHVLEALMQAWIEAQKVEATLLKPVHIELHMEHVVRRPRRVSHPDLRTSRPWEISRGQRWPPNCEHADDFLKGPKEVACLDLQDWVSLEKCWRCFIAKGG